MAEPLRRSMPAVLDDLERGAHLSSDVGVETTVKIIRRIEGACAQDKVRERLGVAIDPARRRSRR
ncbi:MAG: hypothetical protein ACLU9X_11290 [Alistipes shahii]